MEKQCQECGKTFIATHYKITYCSDECRKNRVNRVNREKKKNDKEYRELTNSNRRMYYNNKHYSSYDDKLRDELENMNFDDLMDLE